MARSCRCNFAICDCQAVARAFSLLCELRRRLASIYFTPPAGRVLLAPRRADIFPDNIGHIRAHEAYAYLVPNRAENRVRGSRRRLAAAEPDRHRTGEPRDGPAATPTSGAVCTIRGALNWTSRASDNAPSSTLTFVIPPPSGPSWLHELSASSSAQTVTASTAAPATTCPTGSC